MNSGWPSVFYACPGHPEIGTGLDLVTELYRRLRLEGRSATAEGMYRNTRSSQTNPIREKPFLKSTATVSHVAAPRSAKQSEGISISAFLA